MPYDFWNTQGELQYSHSAVKLRLVNIPLKLSQAGFDDQEEMHLDQVRNDIDELVQALLFFTQPYHPVFERSYRKRQEQQEGYRSDDDIGFIPHLPPEPTDLDKQKALTDLLFSMQPVYDSCEKDMTNFLELISSMMKAPIAMTSFGPTALEKDFFNHQLSTAQNTELFAFL